MIIDFHTHIFPDYLAEKAIVSLQSCIDRHSSGNSYYKPVHNGTEVGLMNNMNIWGIDVSIIQPVVTKQSQTKKINEWAREISSDRIICFGGIYPHTDDYRRDIDFVAGLGLKGLKFHAEYQGFTVDDEHMLRIYDYALSKGLILLHHAGFDPAFSPPFRSNPQRFANIAREMRGGVIVAAHMGGCEQWDDVERYLAGTEIYIDTSMALESCPCELFLRVVRTHGADKVLFGSDSPWSSAAAELERLKKMPFSDNELAAILGGNAERILNGQ